MHRFASDISKSMTQEAAQRAKLAGIKNAEFKVSDMEALTGSYDTVTCIDVMIHYPTDKVLPFSIYAPLHSSYITVLCVVDVRHCAEAGGSCER